MPCKLEAAFGSATVDLEPWLLPFALRRFKTALQPFMLRRPCMLRRESYKELSTKKASSCLGWRISHVDVLPAGDDMSDLSSYTRASIM